MADVERARAHSPVPDDALQARVAERQAACRQMKEQIATINAERDAAHRAALAGVEAAHLQAMRMRAELDAVRRQHAELEAARRNSRTVEEADAVLAEDTQLPDDEGERQSLQLQARALRHEVSRWAHQVEVLEEQVPQQEAQIAKLRDELLHHKDVLDSTSHIAKHQQIEQQVEGLQRSYSDGVLPSAALPPAAMPALGATQSRNHAMVPLFGGGHSSIEAEAERRIRVRTEERNESLAGKVRRLTEVSHKQQFYIQRLERELMREEADLEQREAQLAAEARRKLHLKGALRRCSDDVVAMALWPPPRTTSLPPGRLSADGEPFPTASGVVA